MEVYSVATDEDGSYTYSLGEEGSIGVYDPDGDVVEVWTVDDPSWEYEATHFGVDKAAVRAALAQREYETERTDKIDALVEDLQGIDEYIATIADEDDRADATAAIKAYDEATEAAWDAFDNSGSRDAKAYSTALHHIAENQVWEIATALGYNTEMAYDDYNAARANHRDVYLEKRFSTVQDRLKRVSQQFWDLDNPDRQEG